MWSRAALTPLNDYQPIDIQPKEQSFSALQTYILQKHKTFLLDSMAMSQREGKTFLLSFTGKMVYFCYSIQPKFWHKIPCTNLYSIRSLTHGQGLISLKENRDKLEMQALHMPISEVSTLGKKLIRGLPKWWGVWRSRPTKANWQLWWG